MYFSIPQSTSIVTVPDFSDRPFVAGYEQTITGATTFTLNGGCARGIAAPGTIEYPSVQPNLPGVLTVDVSQLATVGVSGCFPIALPQAGLAGNNTTFQVLVLGDSTGKNPTIAVVATGANFIPQDTNGNNAYDLYARVGLVYINGTTFHIIPWIQTGHYEVRNYVLADAVRVLITGAATAPTLVDLSLGNGPVTPKFTSKVLLLVEFNANVQTDSLMLTPTGLTSASVPPVQFENAVVGINQLSNVEMAPGIDVVTGHSGVDYSATSALDVTSIWVSGLTDDMQVQIVNP